MCNAQDALEHRITTLSVCSCGFKEWDCDDGIFSTVYHNTYNHRYGSNHHWTYLLGKRITTLVTAGFIFNVQKPLLDVSAEYDTHWI